MDPCIVCGKQSSRVCAGCRLLFYCSSKHQYIHMSQSSHQCGRFFDMKMFAAKGRCLVSRRELKFRQILFLEEPLVVFPASKKTPFCLGCSELVDGDIRCDICGWTICSPNCPRISAHLPECLILNKIVSSETTLDDLPYSHIPIFRCMGFKFLDPPLWRALLSLENSKEIYTFCKKQHSDVTYSLPIVRKFINSDEFSDDILLDLCCVIHRNTFNTELYTFNNPYRTVPPKFSAIYRCASHLHHSCIPNCIFSIDECGEIAITVLRDIPESEVLTIAYADPFLGTRKREKYLMKNRLMHCFCRRCSDSTELGTYISSLACSNCEKGIVSPILDTISMKAEFRCDTCEKLMSREAYKEKEKFLDGIFKGRTSKKIKDCVSFIRSARKQSHPNHEAILRAERLISRHYDHYFANDRYLTSKKFRRYADAKLHLMDVHKKLIPGKHASYW